MEINAKRVTIIKQKCSQCNSCFGEDWKLLQYETKDMKLTDAFMKCWEHSIHGGFFHYIHQNPKL